MSELRGIENVDEIPRAADSWSSMDTYLLFGFSEETHTIPNTHLLSRSRYEPKVPILNRIEKILAFGEYLCGFDSFRHTESDRTQNLRN